MVSGFPKRQRTACLFLQKAAGALDTSLIFFTSYYVGKKFVGYFLYDVLMQLHIQLTTYCTLNAMLTKMLSQSFPLL